MDNMKGQSSTETAKTQMHQNINDLRLFDRCWKIRVNVIHRGNIETYSNSKGSGRIWKLILMDNQGSKVQAVLFNDAIDLFNEFFLKDNSYSICDGLVKPVNSNFMNAHPKVELVLSTQTKVQEISELEVASAPMMQHFIPFNEIHADITELIDVLGLVTYVQAMITSPRKGTKDVHQNHNIMLMDSNYCTIRVTLWGDLAQNEGQELEKMILKKPIVALSNVKISNYEGTLSLSSISITCLEIKSKYQTSKGHQRMAISSKVTKGDEPSTSSTPKRAMQAGLCTIKELISKPLFDFKLPYSSFKAQIASIKNPVEPWYEACKECNKKIVSTEEGHECLYCDKKEGGFNLRYMLKLVVSNETSQASVTLFDTAQNLIGCTVDELKEKQLQAHKGKSTQDALLDITGKWYIFSTKVNERNEATRSIGKFVIQDVYKEEEQQPLPNNGISEKQVSGRGRRKKIKIEK